ncbi:preprotein translocase subunit SecG [Litorisediminicola beolgyonensis]|uniref:Protein-export membrane protein SecG n=1 Tax=Litorisediminicola beolgyonensis TaxID=1173614 RepID=A0ABW3ZI80_9RHOB
MQNVILVVHLLLALSLIGVVLMQRSEGGGLGMGGGGGAFSARSAGTALGKVTWGLAACFIATSITLTVLAAADNAGGSVIDRIGSGSTETPAEDATAPALPDLETDGLLPPPSSDSGSGDAPLVPRAD